MSFRIKQNELLKFFNSSLQSRNQVCDNCRVLHPRSISSKPPPRPSYNSSLPILSLSFFYFFISFYFFFFYSKAADERSRWFVLWLVSAPLSPLSDHLHLLPSIQRHSAVESRVCVYAGLQHMPKDWQCAKYATSEVPIKTNLGVMKQLRAVVKVSRRSS